MGIWAISNERQGVQCLIATNNPGCIGSNESNWHVGLFIAEDLGYVWERREDTGF
jgi:hypothetical protein